MTEWLIRHFIKNHEQTEKRSVRLAYGTLAGVVGIACNLMLAVVKLATGILSSSAAVISDAVNNLSDCISCIITMLGNKIASRPADKDHPFGHGRMEYIVSLIITAIIFSAAFELLKEGIHRILHPTELHITPVMLGILVITVLVKYWMSRFNRILGERVNHTGLLAASKDSLNDVLATSGTILSLILSRLLPNVPVDGITASLVALYVFRSGYELASDIIGKLLGENADEALEQRITAILKEEPEVKGFHDLVIHDYGPGTRMGSAHVELDARLSLMEAHAIIDRCEEKILQECELMLTIHPDPLEEDESVSFWKDLMEKTLHEKDPEISVHDFRIREAEDGILLQFDADIGYECAYSNEALLNAVKQALADRKPPVRCRITFDRGHVSEILE
ncbi:MAG: cation transporter [Solobacterium sp.]|nr:cation transporter [Solobacterium sp.]